MNIGKFVVIRGELNGSEDLTIEGRVEGTIQLRDHVLTIGPLGMIKAQVFARAVIVLGEVIGNVTASDIVAIRDNGSIDGDIISPRVSIAEGAHFRGSVGIPGPPGARDRDSALVPVEVSVPDTTANAVKHVGALQRAVMELLRAFDYSDDAEMRDPAVRATPAQETRLDSGR